MPSSGFSDTCVSLVTSCRRSVSFCIVLCVVLAVKWKYFCFSKNMKLKKEEKKRLHVLLPVFEFKQVCKLLCTGELATAFKVYHSGGSWLLTTPSTFISTTPVDKPYNIMDVKHCYSVYLLITSLSGWDLCAIFKLIVSCHNMTVLITSCVYMKCVCVHACVCDCATVFVCDCAMVCVILF